MGHGKTLSKLNSAMDEAISKLLKAATRAAYHFQDVLGWLPYSLVLVRCPHFFDCIESNASDPCNGSYSWVTLKFYIMYNLSLLFWTLDLTRFAKHALSQCVSHSTTAAHSKTQTVAGSPADYAFHRRVFFHPSTVEELESMTTRSSVEDSIRNN